jgi:hypothetical protein
MTKNFNIVLNSSSTSSFTGNIYNAVYFVNLDNYISVQDSNKKYEVTVRFKSKQITYTGLADSLCLLQINFGTTAQIQQNSANSSIVSILSRYSETTSVGTYFQYEVFPNNNPAVTIKSVQNISQISVKVTTEDMATLYTALPNYVCILHFNQIE